MKTNVVTVRISDDQKSQLEDLGFEQGSSTSEIIRNIIEEFFSSTQNLEDTQNYFREEYEDIDIVQTLGFAELIFWIYEKKINPEKNEIKEFYIQIIDLITQFKKHPLFNDQICREFNKISIEIKDYLFNTNRSSEDFKFPFEGNPLSFDYDLFADFIYNIRYDKNGDKFLTIK